MTEPQSQAFAQDIYLSSQRNCRTERSAIDREQQNMRQIYEQRIEQPDWKEFFCEVGEALLAEYKRNNRADFPIDISEEKGIYYGDQFFQFPICQRVVLIGRKEGVDILIPRNGISRLHLILFQLPEFNMKIIVDVGSLRGLKTVCRAERKQLVHSKPHERNVLVFGWSEPVVIQLGYDDAEPRQHLTFDGKDCLICMQKARSKTLSCGHFVSCADCLEAVVKSTRCCPICRQPIDSKGIMSGVHYQTNVYVIDE